MRGLNSSTKQLRIILILAAVLALLGWVAYAEDTTAENSSEVTSQEPTDALVSEEEPAAQALGAGEMALAGGYEQPAPPAVSPSAIGGAFSSLMSESFKTDLATGAATLGIPIVVPPGRKNVQPNIALSYSSNNSNGICGVGWSIPVSAIQRSTKNGVPRYSEMKDFVVGGEELINIGGDEYRAKIESSFTRYVYVSENNNWTAYDKSGTKYHFGTDISSRMTDRETDPRYTFAWYLDEVIDVYGNAMKYTYEKDEDGSVYLKYIDYTSNLPELTADKRVEFVYGMDRPDKIYNNRTGWQTVMKRRLDKIKVSIGSDIVWTYNLIYWPNEYSSTSRSLLKSIQLEDSEGNTLPAKTFAYQKLE